MTEQRLQEIKTMTKGPPIAESSYWVPMLRDCVEEIETCHKIIKLNTELMADQGRRINSLEYDLETVINTCEFKTGSQGH